MDDLLDYFIYKAESRDDWIEVGRKEIKEIDSSGIDRINIGLEVGSIDIKPSKEEEVRLVFYIKLKSKEGTREELYEQIENEVSIRTIRSKGNLNIESSYKKTIDKDIEIHTEVFIPDHIKTIGASLDMGNIRVFDKMACFNLKSRIGNISCINIGFEKDSKVSLGVGTVNMQLINIEARSLFVDLKIGNINIEIPRGLRCNIEKKGIIKEREIARGEGMDIKLRSTVGNINVKNS